MEDQNKTKKKGNWAILFLGFHWLSVVLCPVHIACLYTWLIRKLFHSRDQRANLFWWDYNDIISGKLIWFRTMKGVKTVNMDQNCTKYCWERQRKHRGHKGWTLSSCMHILHCIFRAERVWFLFFETESDFQVGVTHCTAWRHIHRLVFAGIIFTTRVVYHP